VDLIHYLYDNEKEQMLWEQYLHSDMQMSFDKFKKKQKFRSMREMKASKAITPEEEQENLSFAYKFVKPREKEVKK
jgi:hypothetical protein